jgi:hypothetical protein
LTNGLHIYVALFEYASREDIFIIKLWKWKSRFFKMSAPSAAPPGSFKQKYTKSSQLLLISHAVFNGVCETKSLSLSFILSVAWWGGQTSSPEAAAAYSPAVPSGP